MRSVVAVVRVGLLLFNLSEHVRNLLLQHNFKFHLRLFVQVVLLAESQRQFLRVVSVVHYDALRLVRPQVHVYKEERRVAVRITGVVSLLFSSNLISLFTLDKTFFVLI